MPLTRTLLIVIVLKFLVAKSTSTFTNVSKKIFEKHCPYSDLCSQTRISDSPLSDTRMPCCTQCYCDEDCWLYDNCCPDVEGTRPQGMQLISCKSTNFHYNFKPNMPTPLSTSSIYRMIDTCPISITDEVIRVKCEESETNAVTSLDDVVIVSAAHDHDRIYKNKYCAECNGVVDIKSWKLHASACLTELHLEDTPTTQLIDYILENCKIYSAPYGIKLTQISMCPGPLLRIISACNETGLWTRFDSNINEECTSNQLRFLDGSNGNYNNIYKNAFCFICNQPDDYTFKDVCNANTFSYRANALLLTFLLTGNIDLVRIAETRNQTCEGNEMYDHLSKSCTKFRCQMFHIPMNGDCVTYLKPTADLKFSMTFKLVPTDDYIINGLIKPQDMATNDILLGSIASQLGLVSCRLCTSQISLYRDSLTHRVKAIVVYIAITTSKHQCDGNELLTKVKNAAVGNQISVTIANTQMLTQPNMDYSNDKYFLLHERELYKSPEFYKDIVVYSSDTSSSCIPTPMNLYEMFYCPHFVLSWKERDNMMSMIGAKMIKDGVSPSSEFRRLENEQFGLCLDVYRKYVTDDGSTNTVSICTIALAFVAIFVYDVLYTNTIGI